MALERLDKLLTNSGRYSRREAQALIRGGGVMVDGQSVFKPEVKVDRRARILAEGREIDGAEFVYYMMNKSAGYICATEDERWPAVTRLLSPELQRRGLFPVGRLDADVTGLLILTDDGGYAHRVTSPKNAVPKRYEAWLEKPLGPQAAATAAAGVTLRDGTAYQPARMETDPTDRCHAWLTVTEGKFHEVKNIFAVCGSPVARLKRCSIGGLILDGVLAEGAYRRLSEEEAAQALEKK